MNNQNTITRAEIIAVTPVAVETPAPRIPASEKENESVPRSIPFGRIAELTNRKDAMLLAIKTPDGSFYDYEVKRYASRKALETFLKNPGKWSALIKNPTDKNMITNRALQCEATPAPSVRVSETVERMEREEAAWQSRPKAQTGEELRREYYAQQATTRPPAATSKEEKGRKAFNIPCSIEVRDGVPREIREQQEAAFKAERQAKTPAPLVPASEKEIDATEYEWKRNGYSSHSRKVGTLTLNRTHVFEQLYSYAADSDRIECQPQSVDVMQHGSDYWLCASFSGTLVSTTRTYQVHVGQSQSALMQTQSWGGVKSWIESDLFTLTIDHPELEIAKVAEYPDGAPMMAVRKRQSPPATPPPSVPVLETKNEAVPVEQRPDIVELNARPRVKRMREAIAKALREDFGYDDPTSGWGKARLIEQSLEHRNIVYPLNWNNGMNMVLIKTFFREAGIPKLKSWTQKAIKAALEAWRDAPPPVDAAPSVAICKAETAIPAPATAPRHEAPPSEEKPRQRHSRRAPRHMFRPAAWRGNFLACYNRPRVKPAPLVPSYQSKITSPMLASKCEAMDGVKFPVLATPKLDGVRCLKINGQAVTRSMKPVPNEFIRRWVETHLPDGIDGEIVVRGGNFAAASSAVAKRDGTPDFEFHAFDLVGELAEPYSERMKRLAALPLIPASENRLVKVLPVEIATFGELVRYEEWCIKEGFEGTMLRAPSGRYKCGRATESEGLLMKIKRFADAEAVVVDCHERTDAPGELGAFTVQMDGLRFGLTFNADAARMSASEAWQRRAELAGKLVKFCHQPAGAGSAPRFPTMIGFREAFDLCTPSV